MEIDDLKIIWKEDVGAPPDIESERTRIMAIITGSRRSIIRSFAIDILVSVGLNLAFVAVLVIFGDAVMPFLYKLVIAANLVALPVYFKLYRTTRYLKHFDFGKNVKENLGKFLDYYRGALRFYKRSTYVLIAALLLLFYFDESFLELALWIKVTIVAYLGVFLLGIGWLIDRMYGRRISGIESFLQN
ncbi:MAG TPA: hypothetical protein VG737_08160 [Cyclobacteriaceae bacterium]|nr:hypothetical protein [Cyclobacteriaceae bacterium]